MVHSMIGSFGRSPRPTREASGAAARPAPAHFILPPGRAIGSRRPFYCKDEKRDAGAVAEPLPLEVVPNGGTVRVRPSRPARKALNMETPASIRRHPIHPMLVSIPIGLWIFSLVCDLMYQWGTRADAVSHTPNLWW